MSSVLVFIKILVLLSSVDSQPLISDLYSDNQYPTFRDARDTIEESEDKFKLLTRSSNYKNYLRPGYNKNETSPVLVNVSLDMISLNEFNEFDSTCTISLKMDLEWIDDRLKYESNDSGLISLDPTLYERVWYPKLRVPNVKEPGSLELHGQASVIAFRTRPDGYVFIRSNFQLNLFCQLNFKSYPFDVQKCFIKMESRGFNEDELVLLWKYDKPFQNTDRFQLAGFKLLDNELFNDSVFVDLIEGDKVSRVKVVLFLKRNWYHFLLDVYLPSGLFVTMSWLSFWLEISAAPARVTLGMTTMLTLVTSSTFSRERLPKVSYVHAMDLWIAFCICFVFLSLIEYTFVSYLYQTDKSKRERQKSLQKNLSTLSLASMATHTISQYLDVPEVQKNRICLTIPDMAANLRRLSDESNLNPECDEVFVLKQYSGRKRRSFLSRMFQINCANQELAQNIDRKCRLIFPLCFTIFNVIYWTSVDV